MASEGSIICADLLISGVDESGNAQITTNGAVAIAGGRIASIGTLSKLGKQFPHYEVIESENSVILPGLINAHHHGGLTPFQLGSTDFPLELWIAERLGERGVDPYLDTLYSAFQMIESGVTTVQHIQGRMMGGPKQWESRVSEILRAYSDVGMRVSFSVNLRDQNHFVYGDNDQFLNSLPPHIRRELAPLLAQQSAWSIEDQIDAFFTSLVGKSYGNRTGIQLAASNLHWLSDHALRLVQRLSESYGACVHMHLLETAYQREYSRRRSSCSPVQYLNQFGLLGSKLTLGHGVWLTEEELNLMAETGTKLCTNPSSNLRLRSGIAPVVAAKEMGIPVALGIDEATINDNHDMLQEMRLLSALHRLPTFHGGELKSADVLRTATYNGAITTPFESSIGLLEPGRFADFIVIDTNKFDDAYIDSEVDIVDAVIRRSTSTSVRRVVVAGETIYLDGNFMKVDRDGALAKLRDLLQDSISYEERNRRQLSRDVQPYVLRFYKDWLTTFNPSPYYPYNSRS
jgi:cytosine/adenosine deaminase-related metal-dependent hydrolase